MGKKSLKITRSLEDTLDKFLKSGNEEDHILLIHLLDQTDSEDLTNYLVQRKTDGSRESFIYLDVDKPVEIVGYRYYVGNNLWFYNGHCIIKDTEEEYRKWLKNEETETEIIKIYGDNT